MPPANHGSQPGPNADSVDRAAPEGEETASPSLADELDGGWDLPQPATTEPAGGVHAPVEVPSAPATPSAPAPSAPSASTTDPRAFDVDKTLPSLQDLNTKPTREDRRRFDVRAPRVSRSTRDSQLFRAGEAPRDQRPSPAVRDEHPRRPRDERPRDERPRTQVEHPRQIERRDVADLRLPRRPDRGPRAVDELAPQRASPGQRADDGGGPSLGGRKQDARPSEIRPAGDRAGTASPTTSERKAPSAVQSSAQRVSATASTERAPEPAGPSVEAELRVLGARPVTVKRPKKGGKPKTAREAMREKARALEEVRAAAPKTLRSGASAAPEPHVEEAAETHVSDVEVAREPRRARKTKPTPKHVEPVHETSAEELEKATPRPGFWSRVKRFFSGS